VPVRKNSQLPVSCRTLDLWLSFHALPCNGPCGCRVIRKILLYVERSMSSMVLPRLSFGSEYGVHALSFLFSVWVAGVCEVTTPYLSSLQESHARCVIRKFTLLERSISHVVLPRCDSELVIIGLASPLLSCFALCGLDISGGFIIIIIIISQCRHPYLRVASNGVLFVPFRMVDRWCYVICTLIYLKHSVSSVVSLVCVWCPTTRHLVACGVQVLSGLSILRKLPLCPASFGGPVITPSILCYHHTCDAVVRVCGICM